MRREAQSLILPSPSPSAPIASTSREMNRSTIDAAAHFTAYNVGALSATRHRVSPCLVRAVQSAAFISSARFCLVALSCSISSSRPTSQIKADLERDTAASLPPKHPRPSCMILAGSADPPSITFDVSLGGAKGFARGRTRMGMAGGAGNAEAGGEGGGGRGCGKEARKKVDPTVHRGRRRRTRERNRGRGRGAEGAVETCQINR